jgi:hypothetical protein
MASMLSAVWFCRQRSLPALLWMVAVTAFACQFRPESLLCIPLMTMVIFVLARRELTTQRLYFAGLLGLLMTINLIGHLAAVHFESWGAKGPPLSIWYLPGNLPVNGLFYLNNARFPVLYTAAALIAVLIPRRRETIIPLSYFVAFWGIFLFFYAGSYSYGADVRYSLMSSAPLAILAGRGVSKVLSRLPATLRKSNVWAATIALLTFNFLPFMPLVRAEGEEAWAARADIGFGREFAELVPPDAIVLTQNPSIFQIWAVNSAQTSFAVQEPDFVEGHLLRRYRSVYFHWNFWCNVEDPGQVELCRRVLDRYPHRLVTERRRRDYRYALYKLEIGAKSDPDVGPQVSAPHLRRQRRVTGKPLAD